MSTTPSLEERLAALESAVAEIRRQLALLQPNTDWLEKVRGSCKDEEAFVQAMEYGRAFRQADRPPDNETDEP